MNKKLKKPEIKRFEYQILVNRKVVWRGVDVKTNFEKISKRYPKAEVGLRWVPKGGVLIAQIQV